MKIGVQQHFDCLSTLATPNYQTLPIQTSNSSPEGFTGDKLGKDLIQKPNWPKFALVGPCMHTIRLSCPIFILVITQTPNSFLERCSKIFCGQIDHPHYITYVTNHISNKPI